MRVKILDAWAHGLPIVSTSIGAEGIRYEKDGDILIADQPDELAEAVLNILLDDKKAKALSSAGRANVLQNYNWRLVYEDWKRIYSLLPR